MLAYWLENLLAAVIVQFIPVQSWMRTCTLPYDTFLSNGAAGLALWMRIRFLQNEAMRQALRWEEVGATW